jgi:NhaP-type Na+/H+ or K+/H+ antiporter
VTESQIFLGFGLTIALAVGCQVVADRFRLPAIVLLLPVGFAAPSRACSIRRSS